MKKIFFTAIFFLLLAGVYAQQEKNRLYVIPQMGLLNGDNFVSGQVALSCGYDLKNISVGLGVAVDYYKMRTIPVFAELRAPLGKSKQPFLYLNAGPNFTWPLQSQYTQHWVALPTPGVQRDRYTVGIYGDVGFGYAFPLAKTNKLLLSIGYSLKTINQSYNETVVTEFAPFTLVTRERELNYSLSRVMVRVGIKL